MIAKKQKVWYPVFSSKERGIFMKMPQDPVILLSYLNTQLRDFYPSLEELCKSLDADREVIEQKLAAIGYRYDAARNQFR